jgi:hypothetical protein
MSAVGAGDVARKLEEAHNKRCGRTEGTLRPLGAVGEDRDGTGKEIIEVATHGRSSGKLQRWHRLGASRVDSVS